MVLLVGLLCSGWGRAFEWQPLPDKITVLVVCSHPDDEGIFFGGVLPYYAKVLQVPTALLAMTSGGGDPSGNPLRENELRNACWTYGLRYEPIFARFRDIPSHNPVLISNPYTNTIDLTWDCWADWVQREDGSTVEAGKLRAANFIAEKIRRLRPEIIVTHDLNGEYGHDNHKATARAVTNAFTIAADSAATGTNLIGLPPWQVKKLYLHLYPTNQMFHRYWEIPAEALTNRSARQVADAGLLSHVSQSAQGPRVASSVYRFGEVYDDYPSEWWGLYASTVGADPVLTQSTNIFGYTITNGVAAGNFLQNVPAVTNSANRPPQFIAGQFSLKPAKRQTIYLGQTLANKETDADLPFGDTATFTKLSGPAWLIVAPDGELSGAPADEDVGINQFIIRVTDSGGLSSEALVSIDVMPHSIVSWWKLDEMGSTVLHDSVPPALNGVISGGVLFNQPGATLDSGGSLQFDGASGKVDIFHPGELSVPTFTVALWAKVINGSGTYRSPLTNRRTTSPAGYMFYAGSNNRWQFWTGNGSGWNTLDAGVVTLNEWVHLAASYDGTTVRFYRNGNLMAAAPATVLVNSQFPLRLGAGGTEGPGQYWFPGNVDDVRLYQEALTDSEISLLYLNQLSPLLVSHTNQAPAFASSTLFRADAVIGANYIQQTVSDSAADPDPGDVLTFDKLSGPTWLTISTDGGLAGQPQPGDLGTNIFQVRVTDGYLATATATLQINVRFANSPGGPGGLAITAWSLNGGQLQLQGYGLTNQTYVLEASTNFLNAAGWLPIATNHADANARFIFGNIPTSNYRQRYFRVLTQ